MESAFEDKCGLFLHCSLLKTYTVYKIFAQYTNYFKEETIQRGVFATSKCMLNQILINFG